MEVDFMEFSKFNNARSTILKKKKEENPRGSEIDGDSFSQKLQDINTDLGYNENPLTSAPDVDPCKGATSNVARSSLNEIQQGHMPQIRSTLHL